MPLLRANAGYRQIFETNNWGEVVPPEKARAINVCTTNQITCSEGAISFLVVVKLRKNQLRPEDDVDALAISWLKRSLPTHLATAHYWDFFGHTWLDGEAVEPDLDKFKSFEVSVDLTENAARQLTEAIQHQSNIKNAFEGAKARLWDFAAHNTAVGFAHSISEARGCFNVIERVLSASAGLGGYSARDARNAWNSYQELARRKIENNHNYQCALSSLQRFVYGVSFPNCWGRRPDA